MRKIQLSSEIFDTAFLNLIPHRSRGKFESYLKMPIPYPPVRQVYDELLNDYLTLKTRGEAHVTVIGPHEFNSALASKIPINELYDMAESERLQKSKFEIVGLGSGKVTEQERVLETFFIVIKSPELLGFRQKVFELFKARGGNSGDFQPEVFYPHITVGFTHRDLHLSDGIIKDERSLDRRYRLIVG